MVLNVDRRAQDVETAPFAKIGILTVMEFSPSLDTMLICLVTGQHGRKIWTFKKRPNLSFLRQRHGKFDPGKSFKLAFSVN